MKPMDRMINLFAVLCVLIFGLCEACWKIEDDWPRNVLPLSLGEIQAQVNEKIWSIKDTRSTEMESIHERIQEYEKDILEANKESNGIRKISAKIQQDLEHEGIMVTRYDGDDGHNQTDSETTLATLERVIRDYKRLFRNVDHEHQTEIENIRNQTQQYLSDSEQGIIRRSRVEIDTHNLSIVLNVPYGNTLINLKNTGKNQQASGPIKFRVEIDPRALFSFKVVGGPLSAYRLLNVTHMEAELPNGSDIQLYNDGTAGQDSRRSLYRISIDNDSTQKTLAYMTPNGTISKLHQTTQRLENHVFAQTYEIWENHPETKWSLAKRYTDVVDLNNAQAEFVLDGLCQSSLNMKKYEGNQVISEKRLICKDDPGENSI